MSNMSADKPKTTREQTWERLRLLGLPDDLLFGRWANFPLIRNIPAEEWQEMHSVPCVMCGEPGRLYASGPRCDDHKP